MGAMLSGGGAGCDQQAEQHQPGSGSGAPTSCSGDTGPAPVANSNEQTRGGQQSTNTFDTSLQRTNIMGISPLHM